MLDEIRIEVVIGTVFKDKPYASFCYYKFVELCDMGMFKETMMMDFTD